MSIKVVPFFPNRCVEYLPTGQIRWFLFGRRIYDKRNRLHYILVTRPDQFVSSSDGRTYRPINKLKLVENGDYKRARGMGYDGVATMKERTSVCNPLSLCTAIEYLVSKDVVESVNNSDKCRLIKEIKSRNSLLRESYPGFPTCREIDSILDKSESVEKLTLAILNIL